MAVNKVVLGDQTLIDLTADSVTPDKLSKGITAHNMAGEPVVGTMEAGGGKEYIFTNGLTETDGVVKWDLNDNIKTGEKVNREQCIRTSRGKLAFGAGLGSEGRIFASGDGCLAGGFGNGNSITAGSGYGAVAIGVSDSSAGSVYASNDGSVALGHGTKSLSDYQVVIGKDNIGDSSNTYAFIVGNGSSNSSRSNALTVDWSGNIQASGTVIASNIPAPPSADGEYNLHCSIINGVPTYTWKAEPANRDEVSY